MKDLNMIPLTNDIATICHDVQDISSMFNGKRIVITGGQGFLGQYICASLNMLNEKYLIDPCEVIVVDNNITSSKNKTNYYNFSYLNQGVEDKLVLDKTVDYIIFLAGIASPHYYIKYPLETISVVSNGLSNYLELTKLHNAKLLFASSSEIYGNPDGANVPIKETYNGSVSTLSERSCYDESKRLGETLCYVYSKNKTNATIIRPFNFYGPLMRPTDYRVLPNFAFKILNGETVQLYGDGQQTRTFCYITDGIAGMFRTLLLGKAGQAYNIGNPSPEISMSDLLDMCLQVCQDNHISYPHLIKQVVEKPKDYPVNGDPSRRCPDILKAARDLNYQSRVSLKDGLGKFFMWANSNYKDHK